MIEDKQAKAPEIKATGNEVANAFDEFMHAFESYKETNERRLSEIESQVGADVVTVEKMDRISQAMDDQQRKLDSLLIKGHRPMLSGKSSYSSVSEHKVAFSAYIRRGEESSLR